MDAAACPSLVGERGQDGKGGELVPRIISFAWTTPALLAGAKTVTRREWDDEYARRWKPGDIAIAYNRSPRAHGEPVAKLKIISVTHEPDFFAPSSDYEAEGFEWLRTHPESLPKGDRSMYRFNVERQQFLRWRDAGGWSWVIRFEVLEFLKGTKEEAK